MTLEEEVKALRQEVASLRQELGSCRVDQATTSRLLCAVASLVVSLQLKTGSAPDQKLDAHLKNLYETLEKKGNDDLLNLVESIYWGHKVPKSC